MPETTWSPLWVTQAKAWTMASATEVPIPASRPTQGEPVT